MLDCLSACSEDLAATLDRPHEKGGNPGYPARQMLRLQLLRYLLGERYANRFLNRVGSDPRLLELCGMSNVPSERAFSDFKNHKLAPRQEELDRISAAVVEDCAGLMEELKESGAIPADAPALGEMLAVDATDIPAYARHRGEHCDLPGEESCKKKHRTHCNSPVPGKCTKRSHEPCPDPDAAWGYRTPKSNSPRTEKGGEDRFFGYDADVISDACYGLPLYINVRPANDNEGPKFRTDLDNALELHPWLNPRYLTADKGYHARYNFQHLADLGITPVIAIPKPQKDRKTGRRLYEGIYSEKGLPVCIGGREMDLVETGEDGKHRFRCPEEGCRLKGRTDWSRYCDFDYAERPEGTKLPIMGVIHRASEKWKEVFRKRTSIERYFGSAKHSRLLDKHQCLGRERMNLHGRMSMLSYLLTAWGRLMADDYACMRHMRIRLPRATRVAGLSETQDCPECCPRPQQDRREDWRQLLEPSLCSGKPAAMCPWAYNPPRLMNSGEATNLCIRREGNRLPSITRRRDGSSQRSRTSEPAVLPSRQGLRQPREHHAPCEPRHCTGDCPPVAYG